MGVIAQEVEKIIPEVVRTREDGLKAVYYSELNGLLIEAIKEQQKQIDDLKLEVASLKSSPLRSSTAEDNTTGISPILSACQLAQNVPNPFTNQTEINYFLADGVKTAYICIFDLQGTMLQKIDAHTGQNSVTIQGSTLQPGMYLYSLIADGQEVDTKRMILTK
ncbi:hypothetical protein AGMMS50262_17410 [Bacteroidia bacterium]|nr:hypothetical protein AGMMS50262_17410 [Bacteroidia bacterium]